MINDDKFYRASIQCYKQGYLHMVQTRSAEGEESIQFKINYKSCLIVFIL